MENSTKIKALAQMLECDEDEITDEGNHYFSACGGEYLVCDDMEADDLWEESLDQYIEECIIPELPDHLQNYFDDDKWKNDARYDGRGHLLSHYDGCENIETVDNEDYYIYRQN